MRSLPGKSTNSSTYGLSSRPAFKLAELILIIAIIAVVFMILLPALSKTSGHDQMQIMCKNNMHQLALASQGYHDINGQYPPGTVTGSAKEPNERLSCLTELLPYVEQANVYNSLDRRNAWQAPSNKDAVSKPIKAFLCASDPRSGKGPANHTDYVGIAGVGVDAASLPITNPLCGIFGYDRTVRIEDVKDGTANTLLFLETRRDTGPWAAGGTATVRGIDSADEPPIGQDCAFGLHFDEKRWFVSRRRTSAMAATADGSVRAIGDGTSAEVLAALATIAGGDNNGLRIDW